jgi:hypothetical protein
MIGEVDGHDVQRRKADPLIGSFAEAKERSRRAIESRSNHDHRRAYHLRFVDASFVQGVIGELLQILFQPAIHLLVARPSLQRSKNP